MSKKHIIRCIKSNSDNPTSTRQTVYVEYNGGLGDACRLATDLAIAEFGDGDGENGGDGTLRNCWGDIFTALFNYGNYSYANCKYTVK